MNTSFLFQWLYFFISRNSFWFFSNFAYSFSYCSFIDLFFFFLTTRYWLLLGRREDERQGALICINLIFSFASSLIHSLLLFYIFLLVVDVLQFCLGLTDSYFSLIMENEQLSIWNFSSTFYFPISGTLIDSFFGLSCSVLLTSLFHLLIYVFCFLE